MRDAKVQDSTRRVIERWECPTHGAAYAPILTGDETPRCGRRNCGQPISKVAYVPQGVAEALADALDTSWSAAHEGHRAVNPRDTTCTMDPCPSLRAALAAFREACPKAPKCRKCRDTGWCCADQPDPHRCRCGAVPADQLRKEGT